MRIGWGSSGLTYLCRESQQQTRRSSQCSRLPVRGSLHVSSEYSALNEALHLTLMGMPGNRGVFHSSLPQPGSTQSLFSTSPTLQISVHGDINSHMLTNKYEQLLHGINHFLPLSPNLWQHHTLGLQQPLDLISLRLLQFPRAMLHLQSTILPLELLSHLLGTTVTSLGDLIHVHKTPLSHQLGTTVLSAGNHCRVCRVPSSLDMLTSQLFLEKAMAPRSCTLAWKIPWTEEPGRLQSMGSLRVGYDWVTSLSLFTFIHWRRKWQPTPVFLPGESQGRGSLVGCRLWGRTELDTTEAT